MHSLIKRQILPRFRLGEKRLGWTPVADVRWDSSDLGVIEWSQVNELGDDRIARDPDRWRSPLIYFRGKERRRVRRKLKIERLAAFKGAVRANRQLAAALHAQGQTEEGARFAYHAQRLQRKVLWHQRKMEQGLFSGFLDAIAGYGYRPSWSLIAYLLIVFGFAVTYYLQGSWAGVPPAWYEALISSVTAFHGRGFFVKHLGPRDPQVIAAAIEAVVGLLIEISFIVTFTRRFLER